MFVIDLFRVDRHFKVEELKRKNEKKTKTKQKNKTKTKTMSEQSDTATTATPAGGEETTPAAAETTPAAAEADVNNNADETNGSAAGPSDAELETRVRSLLSSVDINTVSIKGLVKQLSAEFGGAFGLLLLDLCVCAVCCYVVYIHMYLCIFVSFISVYLCVNLCLDLCVSVSMSLCLTANASC